MNMSCDPSAQIRFQMLLLQLEEYDIPRFIRAVIRHKGGVPEKSRKGLVLTPKLRILSAVAVFFHITTAYFMSEYFHNPALFLIAVLLFAYIHFVFLAAATAVFTPVDVLVKTLIIRKAKRKLLQYPDLKVVAIAGSYGKTLMKEAVALVLSEKYRVLKTPENINTPIGIGRLILNQLDGTYDFFVVEMGEYEPGDIRALCRLVLPDIGVITGINEAHLERMGSIENTKKTIFELAEGMKPDGLLLLNADDERIRRMGTCIQSKSVLWYTSGTSPACIMTIKNFRMKQDGTGSVWDVFETSRRIMHIQSQLLPRYASGVCMAAFAVGNRFRIGVKEAGNAFARIKPVPHRLQPIINKSAGVLVIDDSYNGNPDGVDAAIGVLAGFVSRRKLFVTPGLVELGSAAEPIHYEIGKKLASVADLVLLVGNSVTPYLAQGLIAGGFDKADIITYPDAVSLHAGLSEYVKSGDVILFQNDWSDNYI